MPRDVALRTLPADPTADMHAVTKQYCDGNTSGVGLTVTWDESPTTDGVAKGQSASYVEPTCITARVVIQQPLKVTKFTLDVVETGTYNMWVTSGPYDSAGSSPETEILYAIEEDVVVTETGENDFTPASPMVFLPGVYYFTWQCEDGAVTWTYRHKDEAGWPGIGCSLYYTDAVYYDGTLQTSDICAVQPFSMTAYKGTLSAT